jgi:hypothetical protein
MMKRLKFGPHCRCLVYDTVKHLFGETWRNYGTLEGKRSPNGNEQGSSRRDAIVSETRDAE